MDVHINNTKQRNYSRYDNGVTHFMPTFFQFYDKRFMTKFLTDKISITMR